MITTNILIIGQTGVGKSSLLNYLFGAELQETGAGKPITERGIYPHTYKVNAEFEAVVYDTWGLEEDHAEEWERLIVDEVKKHDSIHIADWFHTVFFCVSAARARIGDFELGIVKHIRASGCHVIAVITNAGNPGAENTVLQMTETLLQSGFAKEDIIPVSNVEKKTFAGVVERFGREALLTGIRDNLWKTICQKLPVLLKNTAQERLDETKQGMFDLTDRYFTAFNYNLRGRYEKFSKICDRRMTLCCAAIEAGWREILDGAVVYYRQLMAAYHIRVTMQMPQVSSEIRFRFHLSGKEQFMNLLKGSLLGYAIPGGVVFMTLSNLKKAKKAIKKQIEESFVYAKKEMEYQAMQCSLLKAG